MKHADLTVHSVWNHFLNMGGVIDELEVDAYLHGIMPMELADRDCLAQAVNELLDDREMSGPSPCCRAPYDDDTGRPCDGYPKGAHLGGEEERAGTDGDGVATGTAGRRAPRPWQPPPPARPT